MHYVHAQLQVATRTLGCKNGSYCKVLYGGMAERQCRWAISDCEYSSEACTHYNQELMSAAKERSTAHIGLLRHRLK